MLLTNPSPPPLIINHGDVCSHRSARYPKNPASTIAPTMVIGTSIASADCVRKSCSFFCAGVGPEEP